MNELITKDELFWQEDSPNQYQKKYMENSEENLHVDIGASKVEGASLLPFLKQSQSSLLHYSLFL